ncbi:MAG: YicC/YloC family endoribonuclease [Evtepia sp.]
MCQTIEFCPMGRSFENEEVLRMIRSMTGYGRGEAFLHDRSITVELRAVNNRYLDCAVKIPRAYIFAEDTIKTRVQENIARGKIDVFVTIDASRAETTEVRLNRPVADGYYAALVTLRDVYKLHSEPSVSLMAGLPDIFIVEKKQEDLEPIKEDIGIVLDLAIADFQSMRAREGEKLTQDIQNRAATIATLLAQVEVRAPITVSEYREKLQKRMTEVLETCDEARILTEAAIFADKIAVDEETVRLRSHLSQLAKILSEGGTVGRKLDFLVQEFNREANTIGSKCSDLVITGVVIEIKGEIEKIREQVQNIE